MTFANNTPFQAVDLPLVDHAGRNVVVALIKATFTLAADGRVVPAEKPNDIRINDEMVDPEAPESSVLKPTDVCVEKRGTDVIVIGEAISPRPVKSMDLAVKIRSMQVPLRVHGPRLFYQGVGGVAIGPAAAFERERVIYEKAYGGMTDEGRTVEPRNRAGVGVARRKADLIDKPAPQIEHPARPHKSASDNHPPVGFGAIRTHWSPRVERAGTFDDVWQKTRMPLMPLDWDVRANNAAHPSLLMEEPLLPGDPVAVWGMSESGIVAFEVPALHVVVRARSDASGRVEVRPAVDTLLIEPGTRTFEVAMRASFPQGRGRDVLREVRIDVDP